LAKGGNRPEKSGFFIAFGCNLTINKRMLHDMHRKKEQLFLLFLTVDQRRLQRRLAKAGVTPGIGP
tara:strand:+ start:3349 stop:3546 length:198 start_codon:yes stop_codon:yes gene_type:complete